MEKNIIKLLNSYGLEAWYCGGTARDIYLGNAPNNWDVAVKADLVTLREKLSTKITSVNEYSTSVIIKYKDIEYTLYPLKKIELFNTYYNYAFTDSLEEDSNTRDFTINALYYNPITNEWFDFHDGIKDLKARTIRFVGDPTTRILESKIRLLRAPVLSAILGYPWTIEDNTSKAIMNHSLKIAIVNPKQINQELCKLLLRAEFPSKAFKLIRHLNLLEDFFPELNKCINVEQSNKAEGLDLFQHLMFAIDSVNRNSDNTLIIKLAALLHDIGKPYTEIRVEGKLHFYNHENVGAYLAEKILYRWGFSKQTINAVVLLIQNHLFDSNSSRSDASLRKLIQKVGITNIHDLLDLRIADRLGTGRKDISLGNISRLRDRINKLISYQNLEQFKLDLSDQELLEELKQHTEFLTDTLPEAKAYLTLKILAGKLKNKKANLKKSLLKIVNIQCPLDKAHLLKTWSEIQNSSADMFPDGKLKCGVFCNFKCNEKLETGN